MAVPNKQVILQQFVSGNPKKSDFGVHTSYIDLKLLEGSNGVLVQNLYLACHPAMVLRMFERLVRNLYPACLPAMVLPDQFRPGSPISGLGVSKVIDSGNENFKEGDIVWGMTKWEEYSLISCPAALVKIEPDEELPLSFYVGILGVLGLMAYVGFYKIGDPQGQENVFVSAASETVGQLVGQFAKLMGCHVVGCVGSQEMVDLLKSKFRFDEAINLKEEPDYHALLERCFPKGIDIYFDMEGGKLLDAVLLKMTHGGRICACGMSSQVNLDGAEGVYNLIEIARKGIWMEGLWVPHHMHLYPEFLNMVIPRIKAGQIVYEEETFIGIDEAPSALLSLFPTSKVAKQVVVKVAG